MRPVLNPSASFRDGAGEALECSRSMFVGRVDTRGFSEIDRGQWPGSLPGRLSPHPGPHHPDVMSLERAPIATGSPSWPMARPKTGGALTVNDDSRTRWGAAGEIQPIVQRDGGPR
ncbi:hypothetical protein GCM10023166_14120 [Paeniglutamicibacter cryotolerans]|uniref:Uncharacterized protein n=1 Tax=Paeniglutamicibacter cryotolerans TaxID=670079 RepID=A0A839QGB1_9MICC|nr:hypothetical protein [Paeniglutamicibacter cryotolerans]